MKKIFIWLLLVANVAISQNVKFGEIPIENEKLQLYYNESELKAILAKIKGQSTPVVVTPIPDVTPIPTNGDLAIKDAKAGDCFSDKKKVSFTPVGGSGNYEIRYGYPDVWYAVQSYSFDMRIDWNWDVFIRDKTTRKILKVSIKVNDCDKATNFSTKLDNGAVTVPPIVETENNQVDNSQPIPNTNISVPNPTKYQRESANIGQWYESEQKFRLLANTHGDHLDSYYYVVTDSDGRIVYENFGKRPRMPSDRNADYQGDHPNESQLALKNGNYKLTVINWNDKDLLFGVITKSEYIQYNKGGLAYADWYVRLKKGESATQSFYWSEKSNKDALIQGGYCKCEFLQVKNPFYKVGILYIEEMRIPGSPFGAEIKQIGTTAIKYYSAVEPDHNITIEYQGGGVGQPVKYRVLEKNNLDLDPTTFMASPWNTSYVKLFGHDANTFPDSPDYVAK